MPHLKDYIIYKIRLVTGTVLKDEVIDLFMTEHPDGIFGKYAVRVKEGGDVINVSFTKAEFRQYKIDQLIDLN
jgi:fibronectin type 3 domain-containing protein